MKKLLNYHPSKWESLSFLLIPIFIGMLTSICGGNNDIWFILNFGRYILNNGFPTVDPFTIHEGLEIIVQQWAADIVFYSAYSLLGKIGIFLIVNFVNIYIAFISYKLLMLITDEKRNLSVLLTTIMTTLISFTFIMARPQIFSISILLTEIYILEKYIKTKNNKLLLVLPLLSILMINFHASMWLLLFCFWLPFFINSFKFKVGRIISGEGNPKELLIIAILMVLCGFINPYGIKAMSYVLTSYNVPSINLMVSEMNVPDVHTIYGLCSYIIIFAVYLGYLLFTKRKIKVSHFCLLLGTTYLAISSNRGLLFFIIGGIYPFGLYIGQYFYKIKEPKDNKKYKWFYLGSLFVFILIPIFIIIKNDYIIINLSNNDGIDYLAENENIENMRLYCSYAECTYAEYLGIKPYMDSRAEIFLKVNNKKSDIFDEYYYLQKGLLYYKDFLDKYDFTHLLVKESDVLYQNLLHDDDYELIYYDKEDSVTYKLDIMDKKSEDYVIFKKVEDN